ncbi:DUF5641 domain-containing protein [Trichonephila clavipes]|nr:DUF5641 domain-containing protein [Trichonephila clavipes]
MCEIQRAEITLVKLVQQMEFNSEIKDLSCKGMVNPQSKIRNLSPFLDSENVLRVGGRLAHSKLCFDKKHQIILPNNHRLTNLILEMTHKGHFLVGRPITAIAEPSLTEVSDNRLKVWQKQTKIVQHIWKRWSNNYLSTLQNRNKWYFEKNNVKIHDMVILKEDNLPVCNCPLGRILEVYHGKDNKIRVVLVKTKNGIFKRPITKLCILPFSSE